MVASALWYGNAFIKAFNKEIDFEADTVKVMLCNSSYAPDQDAHDYISDVSGEISTLGYTAGGATLSGKASTYNGATNKFILDASDITWNAILTARYAVIYVDTGNVATSPLLGYVDFGENKTTTANQDFQIVWNTDGMLSVTLN